MAAPVLAVRGTEGVRLTTGPPEYTQLPWLQERSSKCRAMHFSHDGRFFAWNNGERLQVMDMTKKKIVLDGEAQKIISLQLSPTGRFLSAWEQHVACTVPGGLPNMYIWDVETEKEIFSVVQKKQFQWMPQWTGDEKVCGRMANQEVHFFENGNFEKVEKRMHIQKVTSFCLSYNDSPPYYIGAYVPGSKGQPSFVRLYKYPFFEGHQAIISNKSFFKADRVNMAWNRNGTAMLVMAILDVDKSNTSYYGEQTLFYLDIAGASNSIQLSKKGPVYAVEWNPNCTDFCVVFGFMPAKATLFNTKCEPIFEFGMGPRNSVYYSPFGNILGGFGNLQGNIEFWDLRKRQLISNPKAPDTTDLQWSPDGEYIVTATTSPRLRVGNGYKIYHYTGSLVHQAPVPNDQELFEVFWQPAAKGIYNEKEISYKAVPSVATAPPLEKSQPYRPPGAQGKQSAFTLHEMPRTQHKAAVQDVDKRAKNIKKKLEQIEKLKADQASGKQLEKNQLDKIYTEADLRKELEELLL